MNIKQRLDSELSAITFTSQMKERVQEQVNNSNKSAWSFSKAASIVVAIFLIAGAGVYAGREFYGQTNVNEQTIPDLDNMKIIENVNITNRLSDYFDPESENKSYDFLVDEMGISLLDSDAAIENPYMHISLKTDDEDYCTIKVMNYILGDTKDHVTIRKDEGLCQYTRGEEYHSPIQLKVDIILSQEQYETGWSVDYLGYYEFVESYISTQGYKVNVIQDTTYKEAASDKHIISEKCFIFVADGIRYTLKGRTSIENMKQIVDSMK